MTSPIVMMKSRLLLTALYYFDYYHCLVILSSNMIDIEANSQNALYVSASPGHAAISFIGFDSINT